MSGFIFLATAAVAVISGAIPVAPHSNEPAVGDEARVKHSGKPFGKWQADILSRQDATICALDKIITDLKAAGASEADPSLNYYTELQGFVQRQKQLIGRLRLSQPRPQSKGVPPERRDD